MLLQVMLVITFTQHLSAYQGVRQRESMARKWAPLVWLHRQEHYYPSSVSFFLNHIHVSQTPPQVNDGAAADEDDRTRVIHPLPSGSNSQNVFLIVDHDFDCPSCPLPKFLDGTKPTMQYMPPVYAVIHSCPPVHNHPSHSTKRDSRNVKSSQEEQSLFAGPTAQNDTVTGPHHDYLTKRMNNLQIQTSNSHIYLSSGDNSTSIYPAKYIQSTETYNSQIPDTTTPATNMHITSHHHQSTNSKTTLYDISFQTLKQNKSQNPTQIPEYLSETEKPHSPGPSSQTGNIQSNYDNIYNMQSQVTTQPTYEQTDDTDKFYTSIYSLNESKPMTKDAININGSLFSKPYSTTQDYTSSIGSSESADSSTKIQHNDTDKLIQSETSFKTITETKSGTQTFNNELQNNSERGPLKDNRRSREAAQPQEEVNSGQEKRANGNGEMAQIFTVTYWMFYPYNHGKDVCTINLGSFFGRTLKPRLQGHCHGDEITMGNHVGDWEHISIQFKGRTPIQMYVSAHNFGAFYTYQRGQNHFVYSREDYRKGIPLSPAFPRLLHVKGSRPLLYSAKGSHGLWAAPGVHQYNPMPLLQDETGRGTAWKTWQNLHVVDEANPQSINQHRSWWRYEGRWGNPGSRCHLMMAGLCEVVKGPTGIPLKQQNFPCHHFSS